MGLHVIALSVTAQEEVTDQFVIPETEVVAESPQDAPAATASLPATGSTPPQVPVPAQSLPSTTAQDNVIATNPFPNQPLPTQAVITATRNEVPGSQVGSSLTVISGETIRNSGQIEVAEVLRSVVGVDVNRSGGPGQLSTVFMRGANGNQTKVLLDGMAINDVGSAGGAFDFSFLTVDDIERIEVLRGPQSTLYGSDAIGGVINIITKRGQGPLRATVSSLGGRYDTAQQTATVSGGSDAFYYSAAASYLETNGFSAASRPPGNVENDGYRNGTMSGRFGWNVSENLNVDVIIRHTDADTDIDFGFGIPQDDPSSIEQANTFARVQTTLLTFDGLWTHRFGTGYQQYDRLSINPFGGPFYGRSGRLDWQQDMVLVDEQNSRWVATSGVDYHEDIARNDSIGDQRQDNLGGFVLLSAELWDDLFLTGGGRWDDYTFFGDTFTYRTTARLNLGDTGKALHGSLGTGFRAPALSELFDPFVGSPNLRPERSKGWDVGLQQSFLNDRLVVDTTYFRNDLQDLIIFDFGSFLLDNIGSGLASGVELTSLYRLSSATTLFANYTYTDTRNRDTDLRLLRRPRNKWSVGANRAFYRGRGNIAWSANYVGNRLDTGNEIVDAYWRIDASAWYRVNDSWRLFSRVDNLLDEDFEETLGYNATRFALYAGAEYIFGPGR